MPFGYIVVYPNGIFLMEFKNSVTLEKCPKLLKNRIYGFTLKMTLIHIGIPKHSYR